MTIPVEIELKLEVPPASLPALAKIPTFQALADHPDTETEISVYFDTRRQKLRRHGLMLRVRRTGKRHIQTVKLADSLFARGEWEHEISDGTPDLALARGTALEPLVTRHLRQKLQPVFETRVRRTSCCISDENRAIMLTLDQGRIDAGERSQPLCEIELELKRGREEELFDVAREIAAALPARLAVESKSERGYALLDRNGVAAVRAAPTTLHHEMATRDGFRAIARACLKQVVGNVPALCGGDPEGVHQMRVALRRLRAAMSLFKDILQDRQTAAIKRELKWLTGELGPARELEVLVRRVVVPAKRHARAVGISGIARDIGRERSKAFERAQDAVQSDRFRRMLIEIAAWIETGSWLSPPDDLIRDRADTPIARFAAAELGRRWRKLRKRCRTLQKLDPRRRHKLRIQGKKLRYASEFFAGLFPGQNAARRRKALLARLESVQDSLGDLNDITVHEGLMVANAGLRGAKRPRGDRRRAFAAGVLSGREDARFEQVLARANKTCSALAKAKPFW